MGVIIPDTVTVILVNIFNPHPPQDGFCLSFTTTFKVSKDLWPHWVLKKAFLNFLFVCVFAPCYHAVQALDPDFQRLPLLEKILKLPLSRNQGLVVLGLHHLDVVKLERKQKEI